MRTRLISSTTMVILGLFCTGASAEPVATTFTFQGQLNQLDGTPVNDTCTMTFTLKDADGGNPVGAPIESPVEIEGGLFNEILDFGPGVFSGEKRWICVEVQCTGDPDTDDLGCMEVTAAPYALHALNGGESLWSEADSYIYYDAGNVGVGWVGGAYPLDVRSSEAVTLHARNMSSGTAISAISNAGSAIYAVAYGSSGTTKGVSAEVFNPDGFAIHGVNEAEEGTACAVYGETLSEDGVALYGYVPYTQTSGSPIAVYGKMDESGGRAVYGEATHANSISYAIRGHTNSSNGYAGYFTGGRNYFEGKVGIGEENPQTTLHLGGEDGVDGIMFPDGTLQVSAAVGGSGDSLWSNFFSNIYYTAGNVGIGTAIPAHRLHVVGDSFFDGNVNIGTGTQSRINLNNGQLLMEEADGTETVEITAEESGGGGGGLILLSNDDGHDTIEIDADEAGDAALRLSRNGPVNTIVLDADVADNGAMMELRSQTGQARVTARASETDDEGARLALRQTSGTETIVLDADHYSGFVHFGARVELNQDSGKTGLALRANVSGGGLVQCNDSAEQSRVKLGAYDLSGGYLEMKDENNADTVHIYASGALGGNVGGRIFLSAGGANKLELAADYDGTGFSRVVTDVIEIKGGADLSEQFDVATKGGHVKPGMVVVIDANHPGKLALSDSAYDRKVAGVVSGAGGVQPGMLMGQHGTMANGKHPIALTGRVWTWCDASSGAIRPGDLLTTSNLPGHAMKVTDHDKAQGAIIGKAMSSLREGTGLVLILVSLQ